MNNKGYSIKKNIFIILTFVFLSLIFVGSLIKSQHFIMAADSSFQLSRANEIYQNLKSGNLFTFIATHSFSQSGVGTFLFYPSVFIYLLALLRFIFNPVTSIWIWIGFFLFLTLINSFYAMLSFSKKNYRRSYLFAIIYTLVPYHLYLGIFNGTYGEFIAYSFLPLVFLGIYEILWGNSNKWYILTIGMTLVCYSHILSTYISFGLCLLLLILKILFSSISKTRILAAIKSAFWTILLVLWQFIPFMTDYLNGNIVAPSELFQFGFNFNDLISDSFINIANITGRSSIGILLVIVLLIGWVSPILRSDKKELIIYSIGSIIVLCSTTFLAWQLLGKNEFILHTLGKLQMTFRLLPYGSVLLATAASFILDNFITDFKFNARGTFMVMGIFTVLSIGSYFGMIQNELQTLQNVTDNELIKKSTSSIKPTININGIVNKYNYNNIFDYKIIYGETDYYNEKAIKSSESIINNLTYINGKKMVINKMPNANQITMTLNGKKGEKADLPIIAYHSTYVLINGKETQYKLSDRGTVSVRLHEGKNKITVGYKPSTIYYVFLAVAVISWIMLAFVIFK